MNDLHGIVFACRSDANLGELTRPRNTCSLPFGGRLPPDRLYAVQLCQRRHHRRGRDRPPELSVPAGPCGLRQGLGSVRKHGGLWILPPSAMRSGEASTGATWTPWPVLADYLENIRQDYVILAWGDMAVNLPVAEVFQQHLDSGADVTMVCTPSLKGAPASPSMWRWDDTGRVTDLSVHPVTVEAALWRALRSMSCPKAAAGHGGLLLRPRHRELQPRRPPAPAQDPEADVLCPPGLVWPASSRSAATSRRSMDLLEPAVRDELFNPDRPIRTKDRSNPSTYYGPDSRSVHSLVADGCLIEGEVENSIISRGRYHREGRRVCNSVLMQGAVVRSGAFLAYHCGQERHDQPGPDAHGPSDLPSGHRQGVRGLTLCARRRPLCRGTALRLPTSFCACGRGLYEDPVCRLRGGTLYQNRRTGRCGRRSCPRRWLRRGMRVSHPPV